MPYKRKPQYGRKPFRPRREAGLVKFRRYGAAAGGVAYKALRIARRLKDMVNTEYKLFDYDTSAGVDWSGFTGSMVAIPQGITDVTRVGDSVKLQNLMMRYYITLAAVPANAFCRVMIIHDDQNKVAAVTDVLNTTGSAFAALSSKNYDKRFQTKILYDQLHNLNTTSSGQIRVEKLIPLNWHTQFNIGTTNVNTGDLKILCISNVNANLPVIVFHGRISFTDN